MDIELDELYLNILELIFQSTQLTDFTDYETEMHTVAKRIYIRYRHKEYHSISVIFDPHGNCFLNIYSNAEEKPETIGPTTPEMIYDNTKTWIHKIEKENKNKIQTERAEKNVSGV